MKKLVTVAIAMLLLTHGFAQSAVQQLRKYCIVEYSGELMLYYAGPEKTPKLTMCELPRDVDSALQATLALEYQLGYHVPLGNVANDLWTLVSQQLDGRPGKLTLTAGNYILTKDQHNQPTLAIVMWHIQLKKWVLYSVRVNQLAVIKSGSRGFSR